MSTFRVGPCLLFLLLLALLVYLFLRPIELQISDLGRHLVNGRLALEREALPGRNLYSYTHPDHPFPNHHWGSGVIFFLLYRLGGFEALSIAGIALRGVAWLAFFGVARRAAGFELAALASAAALPVIALRPDVRPELFSYLLCGVFLLLLTGHREGRLGSATLGVLPALSALWVNLHILFVAGVALVGVFFVDALVSWRRARDGESRTRMAALGAALGLSAAASLLNPWGVEGALRPFTIFHEYGYPVYENRSLLSLESARGGPFAPASPFKGLFALTVLSWGVALVQRELRGWVWRLLLLIGTGGAGWLMIRNFSLFGFFAIPLLAANLAGFAAPLERARDRWPLQVGCATLVSLGLTFALVANSQLRPLAHPSARGIGIRPVHEGPLHFLRERGVRGPIFNNFDIGSYLVFALYPEERVFVDNRPEAYPASFFRDVYVPLQYSLEAWEEAMQRWGFEAVVFRPENTPWGRAFLARLHRNPSWALVFRDDRVARIYLRRGGVNDPIIQALRRHTPRYGRRRALRRSDARSSPPARASTRCPHTGRGERCAAQGRIV